MKTTPILALLLSLLLISGCRKKEPYHHKTYHTERPVYVFVDGHYGMYDDNGNWNVYYVDNTVYYAQRPVVDSGTAASPVSQVATVPSGGSWQQATAPSESEMQGAVCEQMEFDFMSNGEVATVEAVTEDNADAAASVGEESSSGQMEFNFEPTPSSSPSSDAGGSDGGSDGGGGGE